MRKIERIPIIMKIMPWRIFLKDMMGSDYIVDMLVDLKANLESIEEYWLSNPDLRLTQVLVIKNIIPNLPGHWYYIEEVEWVINRNIIEPRDILFWGTYGKDGKGPFREVLIKDMSDDHIDNILFKNGGMINPLYEKYFRAEREYRRTNKIKKKDV